MFIQHVETSISTVSQMCIECSKGPSGNSSISFCFPKEETATDPPLCLPREKPQVKNAKLEVFPNSISQKNNKHPLPLFAT